MHVVGVWQQGRYSYIYRNGARAVGATTTRNAQGTSDLFIGGHPTLGDYQVDASIGLVNVYSRALSLREIKTKFCFMAPRFKLHCPSDWLAAKKKKKTPLARSSAGGERSPETEEKYVDRVS